MLGKLLKKVHIVMLGLVLALPAMADSGETVSGVITNIDLTKNDVGTLTLEDKATGASRTFLITEDTNLEIKTMPESVLSTMASPRETISELDTGDEVTLKLREDPEGQWLILEVTYIVDS